MLNVREHLPDGLLDRGATELHEVLAGPTLIHLPGRRPEPLFVSVLLHGNEDTGWLAIRGLLREMRGQELPRALSLFIGNVAAARARERFIDGQPDFNRIWAAGAEPTPEQRMAREVVASMAALGVFASVDVHNNTGRNPHYSCVSRLDHRCFRLATLFSRTVVYFTEPDSVLTEPFSNLCPSVTLECGQPGQPHGVEHAQEYLKACLHLAEIPDHPIAPQDIDLFHTVATVKVPPEVSFSFDTNATDLRFPAELDRLNFCEVPAHTALGWIRPGSAARLEVTDEQGRDVSGRFLRIHDGAIQTAVPVMPAMLTLSERAIRQDCLCYFMEIRPEFRDTALQTATGAAEP